MGFYGFLWDFMGFYGILWDFMGFYGMYPLVLTELWKNTISNGKTHDFDSAIFNSYVRLPEGKEVESSLAATSLVASCGYHLQYQEQEQP